MYADDYYDADRPRRRWPLVVGGIVAALVLLVVAALIYAGTHDGGGTKTAAGPTITASNPPAPRAPGIVGGFTDVTYKTFYGAKLPYSPTVGPRVVTAAGLASGFAHSQPGAVLAAIHLLTRCDGTMGPAIYTPTITNQWVGSAAQKRRLLAAAAENYHSFAPNGGIPGAIANPVYIGYSVDTQSDDDMTVSLVARITPPNAGPALVQQTVRAVWRDGDWRLVAPPQAAVQVASAPAGTAELPGQVLSVNPEGR